MHRDVHLGIAVDLDFEGLVVPVIRDAGRCGCGRWRVRCTTRADAARDRSLTPDDVAGGTFTLTNAGGYGTLLTAPIISQPQVAIISTDGVHDAPRRGPLDVPTAATASRCIRWATSRCRFDHRAFDGAYASAFLQRVVQILADARLVRGAAMTTPSERARRRPSETRPSPTSPRVRLTGTRRPRDHAAEADPGVLPDLGRRPRGAAARPRPRAATRLRLVLPLLPRPGADARPRHHPRDDPAAGGGQRRRPVVRRAPDAGALGLRRPERRHAVEPDGEPVPARGGVRGGGPLPLAPPGPARLHRRTATRSPTCRSAKGATSEGDFWESLNTACTLHLPVLYVVADNGYAISVPAIDQAPAPVHELVRGFRGLEVHVVDGCDYFAVRELAAQVIPRVRAGVGPALIHAAGHPAVLALRRRHPEQVPLERGARRRGGARSAAHHGRARLVGAGFLTAEATTRVARRRATVADAAAPRRSRRRGPILSPWRDHVVGPPGRRRGRPRRSTTIPDDGGRDVRREHQPGAARGDGRRRAGPRLR